MTRIASLAAFVFTAAVLMGPQSALASGAAGMAHGLKSTPVIRHLIGRTPALAPFAHVIFCMRNPNECDSGPGPAVVEINARQMTVLKSANDAVNRAIRPRQDAPGNISGFDDDWELMPASGDCEDYAITKRHRLIAEGWPVRSLRLAVVKTAWGEGHAVLVVKTNEGDLVLDNLTSEIKPFQRSGLRFLKIQSEDNPRMWLAL